MSDPSSATSSKSVRRRAVREPLRIHGAAGVVLHATPYKETSLVVQAFTREYGRVALVAKGAKRPHSALRNVLGTMQPLALDWTGRGEVKTLTGAHWVGGQPPLRGPALVYGFYLNELLLRLLAREDPHPALYDAYVRALARLGEHGRDEAVLRRFERELLAAVGVGPAWDTTADGTRVIPDGRYVCLPDQGIRPVRPSDRDGPGLPGRVLLDIAADRYEDAATAQQAKLVMRTLIHHALAGRAVTTRQLLIDLHAL